MGQKLCSCTTTLSNLMCIISKSQGTKEIFLLVLCFKHLVRINMLILFKIILPYYNLTFRLVDSLQEPPPPSFRETA